ncbi:bifunctional 3,4-dihydroxy-2-butanone-4-phosphate synthase/GTP cyclohydrolase II [Aquabacterium sp.]|uniref:bifunctional 3,4-dihydroxy-2-butanone-4-phosphate synthase/GTP cyclohydrolase II n=1 Tax=Aquabacterium sp. TaxID=1872578 RepID=UPI002C192052|nr:bifunctional 3,4-dihydroxy-2-butanone-4-phosphate synthase/GTP cyclohydrolase II [Aquabacterium sp.]HSW05536.1 bifunctional 3,4-dihydroxy-2-butanone-4-phosphate synthase/GTP cyclohydrolase II [Aquabacterium sp.]
MTQEPFASVPDLVSEMAAGRMVVLVDDEGRENEGDVILAADHVTPDSINFMARHCRGLICLTLTPDRCDHLQLPPMVARNGTKHGTAFTVSIEAATGIDTGISAADRARTIQVAVASDATPKSLVQPGHVFPLRAAEGGVLMRAGHTEAGCDLARLAGLQPAAVICEVMNDDGTMARLPDLVAFAAQHGIKLGTIADLIRHRSRHERIVEQAGQRPLTTPYGSFQSRTYRDHFGGVHLALTVGDWSESDLVPVRVHEPLSVLDLLDTASGRHSWPLPLALRAIQHEGRGVALLLNAAESSVDLLAGFVAPRDEQRSASASPEVDLRTYGVGAQILRDLGITRMKVLGNPRRFPSMGAYGLHAESFVPPQSAS